MRVLLVAVIVGAISVGVGAPAEAGSGCAAVQRSGFRATDIRGNSYVRSCSVARYVVEAWLRGGRSHRGFGTDGWSCGVDHGQHASCTAGKNGRLEFLLRRIRPQRPVSVHRCDPFEYHLHLGEIRARRASCFTARNLARRWIRRTSCAGSCSFGRVSIGPWRCYARSGAAEYAVVHCYARRAALVVTFEAGV